MLLATITLGVSGVLVLLVDQFADDTTLQNKKVTKKGLSPAEAAVAVAKRRTIQRSVAFVLWAVALILNVSALLADSNGREGTETSSLSISASV